MSPRKSAKSIVSTNGNSPVTTEKKARTPKVDPTPVKVYRKPFINTLELIIARADKELLAIYLHDKAIHESLNVTEVADFIIMATKAVKGKAGKSMMEGQFKYFDDARAFAMLIAEYSEPEPTVEAEVVNAE